ncbi:MAG: universal stress protein [bacterium]|nr:universal stress protein [bacterium]
MSATSERIHHPTDFSPDSEVAYNHALRLALATEANLDILHVDRRVQPLGWSEFPCVNETLERWDMLPAGSFGNDLAGVHVEKIAAYGKEPVQPILEHLDEFPGDMMVLATHRRKGLDRWLHKEIAQKIARSRSLRTLFVPQGCEGFVSASKGSVQLEKILIPVDWIPAPQEAVDAACELAEALGSEQLEMTLLHIGEDMPAIEQPPHVGWSWRQRSATGDVVDAVLDEAKELNADLIVMATQGHDGFLDALRGSTTERVLARAQCPVLAVPATETAA